MAPRAVHVLIAGVSTRAIAESARRAGYRVTTFDAFGDLDQPAGVRSVALPRDLGVAYSARGAARAARDVACDAVTYVSNFENHPGAVRALAAGRPLWGNAPGVLERVRNPMTLTQSLARRGFATAQVHTGRAGAPSVPRIPGTRWLVKPRASGGGHGIRPWRAGSVVPRGHFLQERVEGLPGSVVFVADGANALTLGVSRQLVGEQAFGAAGFRYCGSILADRSALPFDRAVFAAAGALAQVVTEEFGLVGVNGIDFVVRDGVPVPIEVNPRYSASIELVERACGISVFAAHARACAGELPTFALDGARTTAAAVIGKAVVYARRAVRPRSTEQWLGDASVRDVPYPGELIPRGRPICTVFASGRNAAACRMALEQRAARVYRELETRRRSVA